MKKLSLDLDNLQVESFATDAADGVKATVQGHMIIVSGNGCSAFYSCQATVCAASCDGPCGGSGHATCGHYSQCNGDSVDLCWSDYC